MTERATGTLVALFGGTFDPIHNGHLASASELAQEVRLTSIGLVPNHVPPHRPQPQASSEQRLQMLRLAIIDNPLFYIDPRELLRNTPSYTIDTLKDARKELGNQQPLAFIIGQDSLRTIDQWHQWSDLLNLCHLLVCPRPGFTDRLTNPTLVSWLQQHQTTDINQLHQQPNGTIYLAKTRLFAISATEIRDRQQQGLNSNHLLPNSVQHYIQQQGLYR